MHDDAAERTETERKRVMNASEKRAAGLPSVRNDDAHDALSTLPIPLFLSVEYFGGEGAKKECATASSARIPTIPF